MADVRVAEMAKAQGGHTVRIIDLHIARTLVLQVLLVLGVLLGLFMFVTFNDIVKQTGT